MKKYFISAAFVAFCFALASCGGGGSEDGSTNTGSEDTDNNEPTSFLAVISDVTDGSPIEDASYFVHSRLMGDEIHMAHEYRTGGMTSPYYRGLKGITNAKGLIDTSEFLEGDYSIKISADGFMPIYWRTKGSYGEDDWEFFLEPAPTSVEVGNPYKSLYDILEANPVSYGYSTPRLAGYSSYDTLVVNEGQVIPSDDLRNFIKVRYDDLISELKQPVSELTIWHVANMGIILKEDDTVIGIDLDMRYFSVLDHSLFNEIDYFFATHEHNDHFNGDIALIAQKNKTPFYHPSYMKSGFGDGEWDNHNKEMLIDTIGVSNGDTISIDGWTVKAREAEHKSNITTLTYLFESPNGVKILHSGDGMLGYAIGSSSVDWVTADYQNLDFFFTAAWQPGHDKIYTDATPKAFIPLHIQELGHDETERYDFTSLSAFSTPSRLMMLFYGDKVEVSDLNP